MKTFIAEQAQTQKSGIIQRAQGSRPAPSTVVLPTHDAIAARAYDIYLRKGCPQGQSEGIWLEAEKQLLREGPGKAGSEPVKRAETKQPYGRTVASERAEEVTSSQGTIEPRERFVKQLL